MVIQVKSHLRKTSRGKTRVKNHYRKNKSKPHIFWTEPGTIEEYKKQVLRKERKMLLKPETKSILSGFFPYSNKDWAKKQIEEMVTLLRKEPDKKFVQKYYGREFIEKSITISKDKKVLERKDLLKPQNEYGVHFLEVPSPEIYWDDKKEVYWRDTGSSD